MQDFFPQCSFKTWTNDCSANLFSKNYQAVLNHCNFTQATPVLFQRSHFGEILVTDPKVTVKTTDLTYQRRQNFFVSKFGKIWICCK